VNKTIIITIITMSIINMGCKASAEQNVRAEAVAGQFYPAEKDTLTKWMKDYFEPYGEGGRDDVQAVIVPHAGYVFSGATAAAAFGQIKRTREYDRVFLIGPSHRAYVEGASVPAEYDAYATPLGPLAVDRELCDSLINANDAFCYEPSAHIDEHCLEVQLPLLKYWLRRECPIVPIIVGTQNLDCLSQIAQALLPYFNGRNLFVISSDFSHYPQYDDACEADARTADSLAKGRLAPFIEALQVNAQMNYPNLSTSACGQAAIAVLLLMMEQRGDLEMTHLKYCNSGDSPYADKRRVVGYHAFAVTPSADLAITEEQREALLRLARTSIEKRLKHDVSETTENGSDDYDALTRLRHNGAFVTLTKHGALRGCIGHFGDDYPITTLVEEMAQAAAFRDPRFSPLTADELSDVEIEISVLTPLKRISTIDELQLHRDGIYIKKGGRTGTFLPQVADEVDWSREEFVAHCARDKAGIGWDGWRDAELYTYQAIVFHEGN